MTPKRNFIPQRLKFWIEARTRYSLSHAHVQMARELGMNPRKLGSLANHKQEPWKMPLPQFIEHCYEKQFQRARPHDVRSIEDKEREKRERKQVKHQRQHDGEAGDTSSTQATRP